MTDLDGSIGRDDTLFAQRLRGQWHPSNEK